MVKQVISAATLHALVVWLSVLVITMICVSAQVSHGQPSDLEIKMLQLIHRHGARAPETSFNQSQICGSTPCGFLTTGGISMMLKLGNYVQEQYVINTSKDKHLNISRSYDLNQVYSRSTDVLRCLQSADAFLKGLFPNDNSLYPAIHTVDNDEDYLLNADFYPPFSFYYDYDKPRLRSIGNPTTDKNFPDFATLTNIGKEVYCDAFCSNFETRSDCATRLFDIAAAKQADGTLNNDTFKLLHDNIEKLKQVSRAEFAVEFGYNRSDVNSFQQGGPGQPFLQQLLQNINKFINGTDSHILFHYSAHDVTLSGISSTLLDMSEDAVLPPFAQALFFELLYSPSTSEYYVRVLRGQPGQEPPTDYNFSLDDNWKLQCVNASMQPYVASQNLCPLSDFTRLMQYTAPSTSLGLCYLDAEFRKLRDCPAGGIMAGETPPTLTPACVFFRRRCPSYACDSGYTLNMQTMQCMCSSTSCLANYTTQNPFPTNAPTNNTTNKDVITNNVAVGAVVGISIGTFCVGVLVSMAITAAVCIARHKQSKYELYQTETIEHVYETL